MIIDTEFNSAAQIHSKVCVDAAVLAEQRGFGGIWKGESNSRDPMILLSAMAARTERVDLGTAIYHVYGRSPVTLALQAACLNEFSDGRLILGLGVANPVIAGWHGDEFTRPLARLPDHDGDFFKTSNGFRMAFRPPDAPLRVWIAALGPQISVLAGKLSDGILINLANPHMIEEILQNFHAGAREAGRDPAAMHAVSKVRVSLHEDPDRARWALKKVLTFYSLQAGYSDMLRVMGWGDVVDAVKTAHRSDGFAAARALIPDEMINDVPMYAGSNLDRLPEKLAGYEKAGISRCVVAYVPADDEQQWQEIRHYLDHADFARQGTFA
jgi:alkanesulfonate monooxygenase SsuD/methylene tetrahydromethanopterin reductase-like flavin-dependent oxidoreductase (luciferase family)